MHLSNNNLPTPMKEEVILGDCLEIMRGFPDKSFDLVLTDPPYGMSYQSSWRTDMKRSASDDGIEWFEDFAHEAFRLLRDDRHIYIFCNDYCIGKFREWLEAAGFKNRRTLIWVKNNHTSGDLEGDYANKTEYILYAHKGRRTLKGARDTNVIHERREHTDAHPTQKPVNLCQYFIEKSTEIGESVLDPFAGSGTTGVAAKYLKRDFTLIEISPKYCEIIRNRLSQQQLPL